jgi:hypothetical protein
LYRVPEAMALLSLSRSVLYEQIRAGRLRSVTQGRTRLVPGTRSPTTSHCSNAKPMTARRSRGDGGLSWDESRQRWIAAVTVGYSPMGKRIVRRASGRTKTEVRAKLKELVRDHDDGIPIASRAYTVGQAVEDWLDHGLGGRDPSTAETSRILARQHVIPVLGSRKLIELSAEDVDRWLADKARTLSTSTVRRIKSILARSLSVRRPGTRSSGTSYCCARRPPGRPGGRRRP